VPWDNSAEARRRSAATYGSREYQRNRAIVLRQAGGRCEQCGRRRRLAVDHIVPISAGGTHHLSNLQALCTGPGSCHARKSASEGHRAQQGRQAPADPEPTPRTRW
jgi:5-methylcytosine-specific restriction endonuclease McrA